jgi:hypothetical protein
VSHLFVALSVLTLAVPAWATRAASDFSLDQPTRVQGTLLQPGSYHVVASDDDNRVKFIHDNKVVADLPALSALRLVGLFAAAERFQASRPMTIGAYAYMIGSVSDSESISGNFSPSLQQLLGHCSRAFCIHSQHPGVE